MNDNDKCYCHIHRSDKPGRCYWLSIKDDGSVRIVPDVELAAELTFSETLTALARFMVENAPNYAIEWSRALVDDRSAIPPEIRELIYPASNA